MFTPALALVALLAPAGLPGDFVRSLTFIACGDANGDGVGDLAIGLPRDDAHGTDAGRVFILSGKDGSVIRELHEGGPRSGFGFALAGNADFDGDGQLDLAVAAHRDGFPDSLPEGESEAPGLVYVFSLATGKRLRVIEPPASSNLGHAYASALHVVGMLNGEAGNGLLIESRIEAEVLGGYRSPATLVAGGSSKVIGEVKFGEEGRPFVLGDLNRTGSRALAQRDGRRFRCTSISDRKPITTEPLAIGDLEARVLVDLGDLDGDGIPDVGAIGKSTKSAASEDVYVMSWGKKERLFLANGDALCTAARTEAAMNLYTLDACGAPDVDGDGRGELFVVLPGAWRPLTHDERARQHPDAAFPRGAALQGFAALISSKAGQWLWTAHGTSAEPLGMTMFDYGFGEEVRRVMDFDRDGLDDLAVSQSYATTSDPYEKTGASLQILSSRDGSTLMRIEARPGAEPQIRLGAQAAGGTKPK